MAASQGTACQRILVGTSVPDGYPFRRSAAHVGERRKTLRMPTVSIQATCSCTSAVLIRDGALTCATCGAGISATTGASVYSTQPGEWPEGCRSRRTAKDRLRRVPGVEIVGRGRATVWRVSRAAYAAHYARRLVPTAMAPRPSTDEEIAAAALEAAGTRATR